MPNDARHGARSGASTGYVPFPFFLTTEQPSDDSFFLNWPHGTSLLDIYDRPVSNIATIKYSKRLEL